MGRDEFSQPPEWVADLLAAVLMAHGRGIDAADAAWDFLRTRAGKVWHVEPYVDRPTLHETPSDESRAVLVLGAEKDDGALRTWTQRSHGIDPDLLGRDRMSGE